MRLVRTDLTIPRTHLIGSIFFISRVYYAIGLPAAIIAIAITGILGIIVSCMVVDIRRHVNAEIIENQKEFKRKTKIKRYFLSMIFNYKATRIGRNTDLIANSDKQIKEYYNELKKLKNCHLKKQKNSVYKSKINDFRMNENSTFSKSHEEHVYKMNRSDDCSTNDYNTTKKRNFEVIVQNTNSQHKISSIVQNQSYKDNIISKNQIIHKQERKNRSESSHNKLLNLSFDFSAYNLPSNQTQIIQSTENDYNGSIINRTQIAKCFSESFDNSEFYNSGCSKSVIYSKISRILHLNFTIGKKKMGKEEKTKLLHSNSELVDKNTREIEPINTKTDRSQQIQSTILEFKPFRKDDNFNNQKQETILPIRPQEDHITVQDNDKHKNKFSNIEFDAQFMNGENNVQKNNLDFTHINLSKNNTVNVHQKDSQKYNPYYIESNKHNNDDIETSIRNKLPKNDSQIRKLREDLALLVKRQRKKNKSRAKRKSKKGKIKHKKDKHPKMEMGNRKRRRYSSNEGREQDILSNIIINKSIALSNKSEDMEEIITTFPNVLKKLSIHLYRWSYVNNFILNLIALGFMFQISICILLGIITYRHKNIDWRIIYVFYHLSEHQTTEYHFI